MTTALHAAELRRELSQRAHAYAESHGLPYFLSLGGVPAAIFERDGDRHGNFIDASFERIVARPAWAKRLGKRHTHQNALPVERRSWVGELDSSMSSDALLMNAMCYPNVFASGVGRLLGVAPDADVSFGVRARVPFQRGADNTELDMVAGDLIVEAKLTETGFGSRAIQKLERYRDLYHVFDVSGLPLLESPGVADDEGDDERKRASDAPLRVEGYQLMRSILAAHQLGLRFRLVYDDRRLDLGETMYRVLRAVRDAELRSRCGVFTWQEIARVSPTPLRAFLGEKYGIA